MSLTEKIKSLQESITIINDPFTDANLRRAEELADQYADIKPQPWVVKPELAFSPQPKRFPSY